MPQFRTIKLPVATDVDPDLVANFLAELGYDDTAQKRVTAVRINAHRVQVDVKPRPDVAVTVTHAMVWPEGGDHA